MVLGLTVALFHIIPLTETDSLLPASQVSIAKPSFPFKLNAFRRKSSALGAELFALCKPKGSLVSRAHFLAQSSSSESLGESRSSQNIESDKALQGLRSNGLKGSLRTQVHGDNPRQALQRLRGFSAPRKDALAKKVVGSEQRRRHLFLDPPAHLQRDPHAEGLESSHVEKDHPNSSNVIAGQNVQPPRITGRNAQPSKRQNGRNSLRGFDVLDDLMSSQGRSSRALLDSLQSEVAIEKDEIMNFEADCVENAKKSPPLSQSFTARNYTAGKLGGISQMIPDSRRVQRWQQVYEDTTDSASVSSPFASSIQKALSPPVVAKSVHATNTSPSNASVVQQSVKSPQLEDISDVPQPGLRGQEVLWALQKAAIEKAKQKQKSRKPNDRAVRGKESVVVHDSGDWRNAKPIVLKPEWALQIDDLERRIEALKNSIT